MFRYEVGMVVQPTADPLESDHAGKVEQLVEQHRCDDEINEDVAPVDVMIIEPFPCRALTRRGTACRRR